MANSAVVAESEGLEKVSRFVAQHDCKTFTMHNLVWTTLSPLISLLDAKRSEVNELGCFLIACLSRTNQQTSKLFLEGRKMIYVVYKMLTCGRVPLYRCCTLLAKIRIEPGSAHLKASCNLCAQQLGHPCADFRLFQLQHTKYCSLSLSLCMCVSHEALAYSERGERGSSHMTN